MTVIDITHFFWMKGNSYLIQVFHDKEFLSLLLFILKFFVKQDWITGIYPTDICLFKVNNENTKTRCKFCVKLIIKTPEQCYWRRSGAFNVNFEKIVNSAWIVKVFLYFSSYLYSTANSTSNASVSTSETNSKSYASLPFNLNWILSHMLLFQCGY